jgi:hypothetical protein
MKLFQFDPAPSLEIIKALHGKKAWWSKFRLREKIIISLHLYVKTKSSLNGNYFLFIYILFSPIFLSFVNPQKYSYFLSQTWKTLKNQLTKCIRK